MNDKTGGQAFPIPDSGHGGPLNRGMTLRDYFAAKAMNAYLQATNHPRPLMKHFAEDAYEMADAMIEARNK